MGGIRAIPDVRKEVEGYISHLKSIIPTLQLGKKFDYNFYEYV
jgi:hypothetical protein